MSNILFVLLMFLRCHFEAILHCVAIFSHFTIHLRQELLCVFNDFDIFDNQTKSNIFRSESLCVVLNALLTSPNLDSRGDF